MELSPHLIAHTDPVSNPKAQVVGKGFRITVLTDRLFRVETSKTDTFIDEATQGVWFRNFEVPTFSVNEGENYLTITTDKCSLLFDKTANKAKYVQFEGGAKVACDNKENLKGTYRTLDMTIGGYHFFKGKIRLSDGVVSTNGVAVIEDKGLILGADGKVKPREADTVDKYVFCYGRNYRAAVQAYYGITGGVPLIPRYALGNWWSRYKAYTQQEYIDLMTRFVDSEIPVTVATIDMDWHWVNVKEKFGEQYKSANIFGIQGDGWTGYSWNTDLFPDYKGFLAWLKDKNFRVTVNLHPASGVRPFEDMYEQMAAELGIDTSVSRPDIPFDISDSEFINAYFKVLHKPYEADGVDFWWIDWQQGTKSKMNGLDPLWSLNHYHYLDNVKKPDGTEGRPLILSRFAGLGSHRYPLGFSGDTSVMWSTLNYQPYSTATASNIGYTWWSHDIGGHMFGIKDYELYTRWLQFGVFSPINRLHSTSNELQGKEPWKFDGQTERIAVDFLRLRHKLLPYLYTMNYRTYSEGLALCEPMYYSYPDAPEAYKVKNQYMFGSELMVCPITHKADKKTHLGKVHAWIPSGRWTDIFTGYVYDGGRNVDLYRDATSIPVLAKAGAIIPLGLTEGNDSGNPEDMEIWAYRGNGEFTMYEDKGDNSYVTDYALTKFMQAEGNGNYFAIEPTEGDLSVVPESRNYSVYFKDIVEGKLTVYVNGEVYDDCIVRDKCLKVRIKHVKPTDKVEITIEDPIYDSNLPIKEFGIETLSKVQGGTVGNMFKYASIQKAKTDEEFVEKVKKSRFPKSAKGAILELWQK